MYDMAYLKHWRKVKHATDSLALASSTSSEDQDDNERTTTQYNTCTPQPLSSEQPSFDLDFQVPREESDEVIDGDSDFELGFDDTDTDSDIDVSAQGLNLDRQKHSVREKLAQWATQNHLTRSCIDSLLKILIDENLPVPKDARTLLQTPREVVSEDKCGGKYAFFGIKSGITKTLKIASSDTVPTEINLLVNVDGVPLFKSSGTQFWPILCSFENYRPFVVALFYGDSKPTSVEEYLADFLNEFSNIKKDGILFNDVIIKVNLQAFICDAPARSFLKGIKGHTGYFACERCDIKGRYTQNRVVLLETGEVNCPTPRTDEKFANQEYEDHQTGISPLNRIAFPCVSGFCLDYMHMVCLGVVRRLLFYLKSGPVECKLSQQQLNEVSTDLLSFSGKLPAEFARQPRSLKELERWKATEFRQFLLYTGPIVLKKVLHKTAYQHFLCLTIAISILLDDDKGKRNSYLDFAKGLLDCFITNCANIYSESFPVYNVHGLKHLPEDCRNFDCSLNSISSFPFENHLQILKKLVKSGTNPISQVSKRISEMELAGSCNSYKYSCLSDISASKRNGCLLLKNEDFAFVREKKGDNTLVCDVIRQRYTESFFSQPCDSKLVNIALVRNLNRVQRRLVSPEDVKRKVVCLPFHHRGYVLIPLLHGMERYK